MFDMKHLKGYYNYINEKKLTIDIEDLLSILKNNKADIFRTFEINKDEVGVRDNIEDLFVNDGFNNNIDKNELKRGKFHNSDDSETLLDDKYILKFFFIHDKDLNDLAKPKFIVLQYYDKDEDKRSDILGFTGIKNINSFFAKLTDATIELTKGDDTYIYQTSNGGNNWEMRNVQMEDDEMKGSFDSEELQELINKKNFKVENV
jgi:hypothetical protein